MKPRVPLPPLPRKARGVGGSARKRAEQIMPGGAISDRETAFAYEYIKNGFKPVNAARSVLGADSGDASRVAAGMMRNPRVREIVREHFLANAADAAEVLWTLTQMMRGSWRGGTVSERTALAAANSLSRVHFATRHEVSLSVGGTKTDLARLTDEELETYLRLAEKAQDTAIEGRVLSGPRGETWADALPPPEAIAFDLPGDGPDAGPRDDGTDGE
jgi:hypothetical protein